MSNNQNPHKKQNFRIFIIISLLLTVTIKLVNLIQIDTIYYVDVYKYIFDALELAQNNNYLDYTSRGFPFIWLLSFLIKLLYPFIADPILISKILMLFINLGIFFFFYLIIKELFNEITAFFTTLFLLFEPSFMEYSLIAYLEPFSLLMGFLALFLLIKYMKNGKILFFLFSLFISLISGLIRYEMFIIITIPIVLVFIIRGLSQKKIRSITAFIIGLIVLTVILYPFILEYYLSITRFDPFTRFFYGIGNLSVLSNFVISFCNITEIYVINLLFGLFCIFGLIFLLINFKKESRKLFSLLYIFIIQFLLIAFISFASYTYQITNGDVIIFPQITTRQLMVLRIFFIPLFIYFIYKFSSFIISVINKKKKTTTTLKESFYVMLYKLKNLARSNKLRNFFKKTQNSKNFFIILVLISVNLFYIPLLWEKGSKKIQDNTEIMQLFKEAGNWLEPNLNPVDHVFLPFEYIFYLNNPSLTQNGLSYQPIWEDAGVIYDADITYNELKNVRDVLINEINTTSNLKYLVVDWMNVIKFVFNLNISDQLYDLIYLRHEVKAFINFYQHNIYIYQVY